MAVEVSEEEISNILSDVDRLMEESESPDVDQEHNVFELISRVGNRRLLFDSKHRDHKNRNLVSQAWNEISDGIILDGNIATGKMCREKWRRLKDYYYKRKRETKAKSGTGATGNKPWTFYKAIDTILNTCSHENENTTSNLNENQFNDPQADKEVAGVSKENEDPLSKRTTNDTDQSINQPQPRKRKRFVTNEVCDSGQLLQLLKETGKDEDEFYHFGMNCAAKLRKLTKQDAAKAQHEILGVLLNYEIASFTEASDIDAM